MNTAADIATALAGRHAQRLADGAWLTRCPVVGHGKGRSDLRPSLQISDGDKGLLVHCFGACDPRDVLAELRRRGLLDDEHRGRRKEETIAERSEDDLVRISRAREVWNAARDPRGTLAETYLQQHRKLGLPDALCSTVLRFHPRCPWRDESTGTTEFVPALIAAFRSIDDDAITAVHRIRLNQDGSKHGRRMLGIVHNAAIKLDPIGDKLCVGEGLETCMAGRQLGFTPAWALGSTGGISFFSVIDGVQELMIFGEAGKASAEAIKLAGRRWTRARRRVRIVAPNFAKDLNDILMRGKS
jgi:hypothetical protein